MTTQPSQTTPEALPQERLIARVRELAQADQRIDSAMMYGSFVFGEGDKHSDVEFLLFFNDDDFAAIDPPAWIAQIRPVAHHYVNHFGIHAVIFDNLVRGEFHFHRASEVSIWQQWRGQVHFPSLEAVLLVDRAGALDDALKASAVIGPPPSDGIPRERLQALADEFINSTLFGLHVLARGELARALEMLGIMQRHLLWMARAVEGQTQHWAIPSRALEQDLSPEAYARFANCTATLDLRALRRAYSMAWAWGGELMANLRVRDGINVPDALCFQILNLMTQVAPG